MRQFQSAVQIFGVKVFLAIFFRAQKTPFSALKILRKKAFLFFCSAEAGVAVLEAGVLAQEDEFGLAGGAVSIFCDVD